MGLVRDGPCGEAKRPPKPWPNSPRSTTQQCHTSDHIAGANDTLPRQMNSVAQQHPRFLNQQRPRYTQTTTTANPSAHPNSATKALQKCTHCNGSTQRSKANSTAAPLAAPLSTEIERGTAQLLSKPRTEKTYGCTPLHMQHRN